MTSIPEERTGVDVKPALLQVENLQTYFFTKAGVVKAIDGASFAVAEGETLGIVGESGCGKTMTAMSILRLLPKPAGRTVGGRILLDGQNLLDLNEKEMRDVRGKLVAMILQDPMASLDPVFTIFDQVREPVRLHQGIHDRKELREKVVSALTMLQIPAPRERMRDYPHQLSGGMRQRVVGAIGVSCHPKLLICDEPTTALDATIQAQYLLLLRELQAKTNMAMLFITHDLGIVGRMCHRVAVMYAGRIVETAPTKEVLEQPKHPYTVALLGSVPRLDRRTKKLASIPGEPPKLSNLPPGCRFHPRCSMALDICLREMPPEVQVSQGHFASCWRLRDE
jgi:oligopeptide/dipeptide ABC transporter ATP-binding protein